ncbi:MAG: glycosyltransferase family 2 protein [Gammaproteobacteria bacterium]|nr:glycosyltransferase family 2 protein [Gammaproteobacteria bacterium]
MTKATVILPTSIDRGPLLKYSVGSIVQQSESSWELYIIGDGASDQTKQAAAELAASDERIRFFDYPKHARRGEEYRHELLKNARGEIVCYLCDRDLMLPNHIAVMYELLQKYDFGHTMIAKPDPTGRFHFMGTMDVGDAEHRRAVLEGLCGIPLSIAAHRLDAYFRLPAGWRTTPAEEPTDRYMWQQVLAQPDIRAGAQLIPTVVYLRRGKHPGLSTSERLRELKEYFAQYCRPGGDVAYQAALNQQLVHDEAERHFAFQRSPLRPLRLRLARLRGEWRPVDEPR